MNLQLLLSSAESTLGWLLRASGRASVVIVLVLLAQWLLRRQLTPRWRHALWLLVLIRLALPWSFESRLSLFNCVKITAPVPARASQAQAVTESIQANSEPGSAAASEPPAIGVRPPWSWRTLVPVVWVAGLVALPGYLFFTTFRLGRTVRRQRPLTDSAVLNLLEDCKQEMGVRTPLTLVETPAVSSPSLLGFIRPRLLLPAGLTRNFSLEELRYIFLHELGHLKRGDIPLNWITIAPLALHWFNPLVWYAVNRMRGDGELACDALALSHTREAENQSYGRTIIKLLENFSRPALGPSLAGILENQNQMKRRISMIAKFKKTDGWPVLAAVSFAALALVTLTDAQTGTGAGPAGVKEANAEGPPQIVSTSPRVGETEVNPALTEITITFDRDMGGGFSWTGSGPDYPPGVEGQKPSWRDKRTCVFPVRLEAVRYYRVGINSKSFRNFRSAAGVPAKPSAIYFTTQGASEELKLKTLKPQVIAVDPLHGAQDVDPNLAELRLTFSVPMGEGFSWVGDGPNFPATPEGKQAYWTDDRRTCVLPVELKPNWEYRLGLNSPSHNNFQSASGVPLDPLVFTFKTRP